MRLRLVTENDLIDTDADYEYDSGSHNVSLPTHRIPSPAWPKDELPSGVPEYGNGGRIRNVYTNRGELYIIIDITTRDAICDYADRLLQSGWSAPTGWDNMSPEEYIERFRQGNYESYWEVFTKGNDTLSVTMNITGIVQIAYY